MTSPETRIYAGIKWGMAAPTVILIGQFTMPPVDHLHLIREIYEPGLMLESLLERAKEWAKDMGIRKFFCDPSEPDFIAWLRRRRVFAVASADNVNMAISLIRKRLDNQAQGLPGSMSISKDCLNTIAEFQKYHAQGLTKGGIFRDKPMEVDNHALMALHYLVLGVANERPPAVRWI